MIFCFWNLLMEYLNTYSNNDLWLYTDVCEGRRYIFQLKTLWNLIAKVCKSCRIFITKLNVYIQHKLHINTLFPFPTFRSIFNTHTAIQQAPHNMQIIHGRYNANILSYHTTLISQTSVFPLFIFSIFVSKRSNK